MKVLQVINGLGSGGAERLIVETVPQLVKEGVHVDVLLLNGHNTPFYKKLLAANCCNIFALGKKIYNPIFIFKIIPYLKNYDIVHVHLFPAQYYVAIAKFLVRSKVKLIFTEHNTENRRRAYKILRSIDRLIYRLYNVILCITEETKTALLKHNLTTPKKLVVLENGVNLQEIGLTLAKDRQDFGLFTSDIVLVMVAAFRDQKDQDTIIRCLKHLSSNYKLLLVGDGVRRNALAELVSNLDLNDRVQFLGFREDVYSIVKMSDIAILSSHWEGFGLVALESMALGIPTIASDVPGLAQVVKGGGLLFRKGNVENLKNQILALQDDKKYCEVRKLGLLRAQKYDLKDMVKKTLVIYKKIW